MPSDRDPVIRRYLDGDEEAFRTLLEPQTPVLLARIGRRMAPLLRRRVSIQDVLQEAAIVAFERRASFAGRTREDFHRWIGAIVEHCIRSQVNHHAGTHKRALYNEVSRSGREATIQVLASTPSPSQQAIGSELEELARTALDDLPPDYREVLRLHREEGVTLREVGQRMGRSYEAAKKLHGRAMVEFIKNFEGLRRNGHD